MSKKNKSVMTAEVLSKGRDLCVITDAVLSAQQDIAKATEARIEVRINQLQCIKKQKEQSASKNEVVSKTKDDKKTQKVVGSKVVTCPVVSSAAVDEVSLRRLQEEAHIKQLQEKVNDSTGEESKRTTAKQIHNTKVHKDARDAADLSTTEPNLMHQVPANSAEVGKGPAVLINLLSCSTSEPAPPLSPPTTLPERKKPVLIRVRGGQGDLAQYLTMLGQLVRDGTISKRKDEVLTVKSVKGAYYLRPRRADTSHVDEVDHTFECQMLAYSLFQSESYHSVLSQVNFDARSTPALLSQQPIVVQNALNPLRSLQNCIDDDTVFNLTLLNKSLNITKGSAIKKWLRGRTDESSSRFNQIDLQEAYRRSQAVKDGIIELDEADTLAARLQESLITVEEEYIARLQHMSECIPRTRTVSDKKTEAARLDSLIESIRDLQLEHVSDI